MGGHQNDKPSYGLDDNLPKYHEWVSELVSQYRKCETTQKNKWYPKGKASILHPLCAYLAVKPVVEKPARDAAGYKFRAGNGRQVLLISSTGHPNRFIVPAGTIEKGERDRSAALRETEEEAGVTGMVVTKIGVLDDDRKKNIKEFSHFLESGFRERKWFTLEEAKEALLWKPLVLNLLLELEKDLPELWKKVPQMRKTQAKLGKKSKKGVAMRKFVVHNIEEVRRFCQLKELFGKEHTVKWLSSTGVDPSDPLDAFRIVFETISTNKEFEHSKGHRDTVHWQEVVTRLHQCSKLAKITKENKCYKKFLEEVYMQQKELEKAKGVNPGFEI